MIFVCLGTQSFQFDRLLIKLDQLIEKGFLDRRDVFVQAGSMNYVPKYLFFKKFLSHDEFEKRVSDADLIISHGGTGALIGALRKGKNVIAVPRLARFNEHIDDHQLQVVKVLEDQGYLRAVYDVDNLLKTINEALKDPITKEFKSHSSIVGIISNYIDSLS